MNSLRKKDDVVYRLASMQARIFERSADANLPSFYFIQAFMYSSDATQLDNLLFLLSGSSEKEIYQNALRQTKKRNGGTVYPPNVMHWIGFFYRYASYIYGIPSASLFKGVPPKYLNRVYDAYHGLDIIKAVDTVFADLRFVYLTPNERFEALYRGNKTLKAM